ncbi:TPA: hypothetical protein QCK47_004455 [Salmonella enterica subsp. enterica serovar Derby]|nr:hypothetical protein [Salmonella enterica subsp. enterica serovar Derby]
MIINNDIEKISVALTENEFKNILVELGYHVVIVPQFAVMPDGRKFVWHKPFISKVEADKALAKFRRGES